MNKDWLNAVLTRLKKTLDLLSRTLRNQGMLNEIGQAVLGLIADYSKTWYLLLEFDEGRLIAPPSTKSSTEVLEYACAVNAIDVFHLDLAAKGEASSLFGRERGDVVRRPPSMVKERL